MSVNQNKQNSTAKLSTRSGFTLVEMLISVTLVLLIMTMFASIFQVATNSVTTQRGIAESDQKVRGITTLIRGDLAKRTQRYPLAFYPGEDLDLGAPSPDLREGYFYLSTNDPDNKADTLLQFTVRANLIQENDDDSPYIGSSEVLVDRNNGNSNLFLNPNQPEVDDGSLSADGATSSVAAQIAYFIRNGNLYRRVVLIRDPLRVAGSELGTQPTSTEGFDYFSGLDSDGNYDGAFQISSGLSDDFHLHFDLSAVASNFGGDQSVTVLGTDALANTLVTSGAAAQAFGDPRFRFGFDQFSGRSREHDSINRAHFMGRFLHAETSNVNFNWPMRPTEIMAAGSGSRIGNPYDITNIPLTLVPNEDLCEEYESDPLGLTSLPRGGSRRMEDLVLANVHEFVVEIWDDRLGDFVEPGYGSLDDDVGVIGDYHIRRNLNADVITNTRPVRFNGIFNNGPFAPYNSSSTEKLRMQPRIFDTWHPTAGQDIDGDGTVEMSEFQAPYIAYVVSPPRQNDTPPGPSSPSAPALPVGGPAVPSTSLTYQSYWQEDTNYRQNDVVFARDIVGVNGWDADGDGNFNWVADRAANPAVIPDQGFQIAYRCVATLDGSGNLQGPGSVGTSNSIPPVWPETPGIRVTDGSVIWESFDNRRPLKAIRIRLRFINSSTEQPRQLTLVIPLTGEE